MLTFHDTLDMPAARKRQKTPNMNGMTAKQMRRKKPINLDHLKTIEPLTDNQEKVFNAYAEGKNLVLHGAAGTGKTFISLYVKCCNEQMRLIGGDLYEIVALAQLLAPLVEHNSVLIQVLSLPNNCVLPLGAGRRTSIEADSSA